MPQPDFVNHRAFGGLNTSIADPPSNTMKGCKNVVLNRVRGLIQQPDGYEKKFPTLPNTEEATNVAKQYSNFVWKDIKNFKVTEHGGADITVAVGTYRKNGFFDLGDPQESIDRFGVFCRPYWDGSEWIDDWRELTEVFLFEIQSLGNANIQPMLAEFITFGSNSSVGTVAWTNPDRVASDNNTFAQVPLQSNQNSQYLTAQGYTVAMPVGAVFDGARIFIKRRKAQTGAIKDLSVKLMKNGAIVGDEKVGVSPSNWNEIYQTVSYGTPTDSHGLTFVNGDNLGVAIAVDGSIQIGYAEIEYIYVRFYYRLAGAYNIFIDTGAFDFANLVDPQGLVFNDTYFKNWTIVYQDYQDTENYDLVVGCGYDGSDYFLSIPHLNSDYASRVVGTKLLVYRNFLIKDLPTDVNSYIYKVLSEVRISSGNRDKDVPLMVGFREKDLSISLEPYLYPQYEGLIADHQMMEFWQYACFLAITGSTPDAGGLPGSGGGTNYYLKYALRTDDGQVGKLYDAITNSAGTFATTRYVTLSAAELINLRFYRSFGAFPRRGKSIVIFISTDDIVWKQIKEVDLTVAANLDNVLMDTVLGVKHFWAQGDTTLSDAEYDNATEASSTIDHDINDDGAIRYSHATVVGTEAYAVGVYDPTTNLNYANKIFPSAIHTDPNSQYDVFPNDGDHLINLEYNDGDTLRAVASLDPRLVAIKSRNIIVINRDTQRPEKVIEGYGIASVNTLASFNGSLYFLDYNGVIRFNTSSTRVINEAWLEDLRSLSDSVKESAIGIIDSNNRQYRLLLGTKEYVMDLDTEDWTIQEFIDVPVRYAVDNDSTIDFLSGDYIQKLGGNILHDGNAYTFHIELNEHRHKVGNQNFDMNLLRFYFIYESDVDLTLKIYKNASAVQLGSDVILSKTKTRQIVIFQVGERCSSFRIKVSGTIEEAGQRFKIKESGAKYDLMAVEGDIPNE